MQQDPTTFNQGGMGFQQPLPNATIVLILSILSIPTCCCYGIVGLGLGITALILANKDKALYEMNPNMYTPSSYSNINTGRIIAIIGIVLGSIYLLLSIFMILAFGFDALSDPTLMQERMRDIFGS
ncbi:CCC motif membrane protein [Cytophagaceae bacterium DM2B3-1]|uniref:CCC motif membrane protein n=1 Tax=Xanthocytophaga flava TaxID=3048013 RepID=A0ABT7CJI3_9BACT|nr:CCC motif membrane protein [Xanthocytophaga flavus]MDJ1472051.1 CCC motif membrane protein [Xanthocytophaga flavus]MDJ1492834.1 CCC motif membrane protein [Xanthocytophaga flavus]